MRKFLFINIILLSIFAFVSTSYSAEKATAREVIKKVKKAAKYLQKTKNSGLKQFNKKNSQWVFKDTYIFVFKCSSGQILAHPIKPQLIGKKLLGLKDIKGNLFFVQMCNSSKNKKGGWTEYWWPKPGEKKPSRKISLLMKIKGTDFQVGAGIYNDTKTVAELNKLLK